MKAPLFIDDSAGLSINQVRARARRLKQQYDIRLLIIDYMQLMSGRTDCAPRMVALIPDTTSGIGNEPM